MSLSEALARQTPARRGTCGVAILLTQISEADRADLIAALNAPTVQLAHTTIRAALLEEYPDLRIPAALTIGRHRNGQCSCR